MPKRPSPPTDAQPVDEASAQQQARQTIADKLREWSGYAFAGGMATLTAAGAYALATGMQDTALGVATVGLGANWFSNLIWELRQKTATRHDPRTLIAETAQAVQANLTDARLAEIVERFNLIEASLAALKDDQAQREALVQELLARKLATPQQIRHSANAVNVTIAESVINSAVIAIGGDNHGHIQINLGGDLVNLAPQIKTYRHSLAGKVSALDLLAVNSQSMDDPDRISLADVYTPLHATASARSARNALQLDAEQAKLERPDREAEHEQDATHFVRLLSEHPRTVILGDPGCGKSTVLSYLALGLCGLLDSSKDFAEIWPHGPMLPLRIILREFARSAHAAQPDGLLRYAQAQLSAPETARLAEHLSDTVQTHGAVWLLDGLDEVPAGQRRPLKAQIEQLVQVYPHCRFVVTCRSYSYESASTQLNPQHPHALPFETLSVRELDNDDMHAFVQSYFKQLGLKGRTTTPDRHTRELTAALSDRPNLRRMGANPLLLSLMVLVHLDKGKLPNNRVELLKEVVDSLLSKWKKEIYEGEAHPDHLHDFRIRQAIENRYEAFKQKLYEIALDAHISMHRGSGQPPDNVDRVADDQTADIPREQLEAALGAFFKPELQEGLFNLESVWTYLSNRVGLLNYAGGSGVDDGDGDTNTSLAGPTRRGHTYKFPHRLIQEYLAAKAIDDLGRREELNLPAKLDADFARWREVTALVALMNNLAHTRECVEELCECSANDPPTTQGQARRAALAGQIWLDREISEAQFANTRLSQHYERIRQLQAKLIGLTDLLTARERAEVGRTLAKLRGSDPRPEVTTVEAMTWCRVPKGPFEMGSNEYDDEKPPFTYTGIMADFHISQYPITQAQYQQFVDEGGYAEKDFWAAAIAAGRWDADRGLRCQTWNSDKRDYEESWAERPHDFGEPFNLPNHPVVGVCWYEALAFCEWLSRKLDKVVRLPTEAEWEYAARGGLGTRKENGVYPWGDKPDPNRANYADTGITATSAVGCFPNGRSPFDVEEMNGSMWEWTSTKWLENYADYAQRESNAIDGSEDRRVVRGGSWVNNVGGCRSANRANVLPRSRLVNRGFRVVVGSPLFS